MHDELGLTARRSVVALAFTTAALATGTAAAHIDLISPPARYPAEQDIKDPPCGVDPAVGVPSGEVTTYTAGETITLEVDEYVAHYGTMLVAIDTTGTDAFHMPTSFDDIAYATVLTALDDPPGGGPWSIDVTLPEGPCDPCTLQIIQIMEDDGSFGPGTNDLYFQCADIRIEDGIAGDTGEPPMTTGPSGDDTTGGGADTTGGPGGGDASADGTPATDGGGDDPNATSGAPGTTTVGGDGGDGDDDGGCAVGARPHAPWWAMLLMVGPALRWRDGRRG
jgi:hypothetical protein